MQGRVQQLQRSGYNTNSMHRLSIMQGARHRTDGTYARSHSVQKWWKEPGQIGPEKKNTNSLYWFSSQKHQIPLQHLRNLLMRVTEHWEGQHSSIPALKDLQKPSRDAAALKQGELDGILRNLLAILEGSPATHPPDRHSVHKHP